MYGIKKVTGLDSGDFTKMLNNKIYLIRIMNIGLYSKVDESICARAIQ
jgi:hypothetical protein